MDDKRRKSLNKKRNNMIDRLPDLSEMERDYLESICKELNDDWKESLQIKKEERKKLTDELCRLHEKAYDTYLNEYEILYALEIQDKLCEDLGSQFEIKGSVEW